MTVYDALGRRARELEAGVLAADTPPALPVLRSPFRPMKKTHALALLGAFLTLGATAALAQPPPPAAPAAVPVDGGLGVLALAGGAYAVKRLRNRRADG